MILNKLKKYNSLRIKNKKKEVESKFNIGLAILRPILSFCVIITHCYNKDILTKGYWKLIIAKTERLYFSC